MSYSIDIIGTKHGHIVRRQTMWDRLARRWAGDAGPCCDECVVPVGDANKFVESEHPRGQPDNSGQFAEKPGGETEPVEGQPRRKPVAAKETSSTAHTPAEFKSWEPPKTEEEWENVDGQHHIDEPDVPDIPDHMHYGAGVIIREGDSVWLVKPSNAFGGYKYTFPKGTVEGNLSLQATAIKEAFEESGLKVDITGFAGDVKRSTSVARYYFAKRVGGDPKDHGWESEAVELVPKDQLHDYLNIKYDRKMASEFLGVKPPQLPKLSDMKKIGKQLGSNPGGKYEDKDGKKYYVKLSKSADHAKNEILASRLYDAAGSPVLYAKLVDAGGGELATATQWAEGTKTINRHDKKQLEQAQENFATHAWLANWDAAGLDYDNQGLVDGKMTTLDPGGSLIYRAQGGPKGAAFGDKVTEWDTLREPKNPQAHAIFGSMTDKQLRASAQKVLGVPETIIHDLVDEHGPGNSTQRQALAKRLIARQKDIGIRAVKLIGLSPSHDAVPPIRPPTAQLSKPEPVPDGITRTPWGDVPTANWDAYKSMDGAVDEAGRIDLHFPADWTERDIAETLQRMYGLQASEFYFGQTPAQPRYLGNVGPEDTGDDFVETEHPRGQPENAGEFAAKGEAGKPTGGATAHLQPATAAREQWPPHIAKLRVPPAWTNVQISHDPDAPLQVVGQDAKGRKQYLYHPKFAATQTEAKFQRIKELDQKFAAIQQQNAVNQRSKDPVLRDHADAAAMIMQLGIRPGSEGDTKADVKVYGATTLLGRHVVQLKKGARLRFTGKHAVPLDIPVGDPALEKMLIDRAKVSGPAGQLFPHVSAGSLLDYIHSFDGGGFKTKDMRTLLGTKTAQAEVAKLPAPQNETQYKKAVREVAKVVSARLGNTPVVALQAYINPVVFAEWRMGVENAGRHTEQQAA